MKKKLMLPACTVLMLKLCSPRVLASDSAESILSGSGANALFGSLPDQTQGILEGLGISGVNADGIFSVSAASLFDAIKTAFTESLSEPFALLMKLMGVIVILSVVRTLTGHNDLLNSFGTILSAVICVASVRICLNAVITAVNLNYKFMIAFVPVFAVLLTVSGNAASALAYNASVLGAAEIITVGCEKLLVPAVGAFLSLSVGFSVNPVVNAQRFISAVNKVILFFVSGSATIFTALLSLQNLMSVSVDSIAARGTRFVISSLIPVVGSAINEAFSTIMGSIGLIRSSAAVFGIAAVFAINLPVLMQAALFTLSLSTVSFISEMFELPGATSVFRLVSCTVKILAVILVLEMFLLIISTGVVVLMRGEV